MSHGSYLRKHAVVNGHIGFNMVESKGHRRCFTFLSNPFNGNFCETFAYSPGDECSVSPAACALLLDTYAFLPFPACNCSSPGG